MFSYIDPKIRDSLIDTGKLFRIDSHGHRVDPNAPTSVDDLTLNVVGPVPLPIEVAGVEQIFDWYAFVRHTELNKAQEIATALRQEGDQRLLPLLSTHMAVNSVLLWGDLNSSERPLVRVHSSCFTGDVVGSRRCDCGPQLDLALERISSDPEGAGALVYMAGHEGRGIGLWAKAITYLLQDAGQDTYQANRTLGLADDSRDFSDAAAILFFLLGGDRTFRLLSNNPKKRGDLEACGMTGIIPERHVVGVGDKNRRYLSAKREKGHAFDKEDLEI